MADEWFGVRCVFRLGRLGAYEERITLWRVADFAAAIASAEREAEAYAIDLDDVAFTGLAQAFHLYDAPGDGAEVFSLIRESDLDTAEYLSRFFDTGRERQRTASAG